MALRARCPEFLLSQLQQTLPRITARRTQGVRTEFTGHQEAIKRQDGGPEVIILPVRLLETLRQVRSGYRRRGRILRGTLEARTGRRPPRSRPPGPLLCRRCPGAQLSLEPPDLGEEPCALLTPHLSNFRDVPLVRTSRSGALGLLKMEFTLQGAALCSGLLGQLSTEVPALLLVGIHCRSQPPHLLLQQCPRCPFLTQRLSRCSQLVSQSSTALLSSGAGGFPLLQHGLELSHFLLTLLDTLLHGSQLALVRNFGLLQRLSRFTSGLGQLRSGVLLCQILYNVTVGWGASGC
mmetsp:Transcript_30051/g.77350  ORF Transcript_30051/g.77350 Transcript_30051/m.77350 type:complete len:293 (-) Transcript_30051:331-1209(-)